MHIAQKSCTLQFPRDWGGGGIMQLCYLNENVPPASIHLLLIAKRRGLGLRFASSELICGNFNVPVSSKTDAAEECKSKV